MCEKYDEITRFDGNQRAVIGLGEAKQYIQIKNLRKKTKQAVKEIYLKAPSGVTLSVFMSVYFAVLKQAKGFLGAVDIVQSEFREVI